MSKFKPFKFDPIKELDLNIPKANRAEALKAAAEYLKEISLEYIGEGKSPVSGGEWVKKLSPAYAKIKGEESSVNFSNLELTGGFLDSFTVEPDGNKVVFDVAPDDYGRAEGFITGQYGKHSEIKPRQFTPQKGETFKSAILKELKSILSEFEE